MKDNAKVKEGDVYFGYTTDFSQLEEENRVLRQTVTQMKDELERMRKAPLLVCEVKDLIGENALVKLPNGNIFFVEIGTACEPLKSGDHVLVEQKNLSVIKKLPLQKQFNVERFVIIDKPTEKWEQVGGLDEQKRDIQEVIELPLTKPQLFKKVGIDPPKAVLLYGPPGTGKTLLAKAVANSTNSTFIEIVGSELVQKFIGEGAKLVKEIFELAKEKAPSIIFIDELDAIASKRIELGTSGEREVQRTFMQLLAEIDGFKPLGNVKIIGCTNRKDILDPAILRPGRFDRQIYVSIPSKEARVEIFKIHTRNMNLDKGIDLSKIINEMEEFSGADIKAVCTEAGYFAIRAGRTKILLKDFLEALNKLRNMGEEEFSSDYMDMFV
jgi:proteasome regulatory subunit